MFWKILVLSASCAFLCNTASGQSAEVHAVGVYEGDTETDGNTHGPEARVIVDRPGAEVILALGSYKAVRWIVDTSPNTNISKIYLHGYEANRSEVLLNDVSFSAMVLDADSTYSYQGSRFRDLVEFLTLEFSVPRIASFHGAYTAPDDPFVVNSFQEALVNQVDYLKYQVQPEALTESLQQYLEEQPEPVARLDDDGFYLLEDGEEKHFPITLDVPNVSWPGRATYDPVNQRLFAGTAWHVGFFYTYDILNDHWSAFEQPTLMRIQGALYDVERERLILGVQNLAGGTSNTIQIMEMSAPGEMTEISFDALPGIIDLEDVGNGPEAVLFPLAIDGDLLLARAESGRLQRHGDTRAHRTYTINLETGRVTLVDFQD